MTKKARTSDEVVIDWFSQDVMFTMMQDGLRIKQLKLRFNGADWLMILTIWSDDDVMVTFVGGRDLHSVARKLRKGLKDKTLVWKPDKFA